MAQRESQVQGVLVEILGEQYRIGGEPEQVRQVAAYVDGKMKEIADKSPRMPKGQVAMLAAMEVTAELFKVMSERKVFTDRANESIKRLSRLVEDRARMATPTAADGERRSLRGDDLAEGLATRLRGREAVRLPDTTTAE